MRAGGEPVATRPPLSIRLLGGIDVEVAGRLQSFSARTQLGLALCVLARRSNERVSTAELSEALWTDERPATYRNVIQVVISKLRAVVEAANDPAVELLALNDGYVLRCPADAVDACVFDSLVTEAMRELSGTRADEARHLLADALGRWAEPFGGHEPEALVPYADQLRRRRREAESALLEVDIQLGVEDVEVIERAVEADPFDERLWGYLMIALYRRGKQADALRTFARARALLADEIGVEPGPFLRAIEQEVLLQEGPHLRPAAHIAPPARTLTVSPPPAALTEVLFRSAECAALTAVLSRSRFVSLVGPPGVGKTTVAAEVARSWDATPVAWLGLGDVAATEAVLVDIALRLGVITEAEGLDDTHTAALQALIGDQPLLLVLDNVEHIAEAVAPFVTAVLQSCRNVTVLTTSRRELGEPGERIMPLRPFETGHDGDVLSSGARYLALQAAVDEPAGEELRTLNRIAADLGGIPLALDLAAAQVRRLGATVVGSHLDILPLARGSRLDESIAWSLEQLPPASQALVGALVHLEAPWPLDRAVAAGRRLGIGEPATLLACSTLVEHSLLLPPPEHAGPGGWRILEPVRQHVSARSSTHDWSAARTVIAATIVDEAEQIRGLLEGDDQGAGVAALRELMPDVRSTMAWLVEADEARLAAHLLASLRAAWWPTGLYADGQTLHEAAAPVLRRWTPTEPDDVDTWVQARAAVALTRPGFGAPAQHLDMLRELHGEAVRLGARPGTVSWVAHVMAIGLAFTNAEPDDAIGWALVAVEHARAADDPWLAGWALLASALAHGRRDPLTALTMFEQAAASFVTAGDLLSAARVSMFRAHGLRIFGITRDSDAALEQARDWCAEIDAAPVTRLDCELGLAQNLRAAGDLDEAAKRFRSLIPQLTAVGDLRCAAAAEHELAAILLVGGDVDGASALAHHATEILRRAGGEETEIAAADMVLAAVAFRRDDPVAAARHLGQARRGAHGAGIPLEVAQLDAMASLEADVRAALGDDLYDQLAERAFEGQSR